jgi:hypothetical protein
MIRRERQAMPPREQNPMRKETIAAEKSQEIGGVHAKRAENPIFAAISESKAKIFTPAGASPVFPEPARAPDATYRTAQPAFRAFVV